MSQNRPPLTKRDKAIAKAKKLQVLMSDPECNEGVFDNALRSVNQIIAIYGVTPEELEEKDGGVARKDDIEMWQFEVTNRNFAGVMRRDAFCWIGQAYGTRCLMLRRRTPGGNTRSYLVQYYGPTSTLEMVKIIIPALMTYAENRMAADLAAKKAELKSIPYLTSRDRQREADQFAKGWWHSFGIATSRKIRSVREHTMDDYIGSGKGELVRQSDADRTNAYIDAQFGKLRSASRGRTRYADDAVAAGQQAGREALVGQDEVAGQPHSVGVLEGSGARVPRLGAYGSYTHPDGEREEVQVMERTDDAVIVRYINSETTTDVPRTAEGLALLHFAEEDWEDAA